MKYYSEKLNKVFDTEEQCVSAEKEHEQKSNKRAERAKEVEDAIQEAQRASKKANDLLNAFIEDYGSYHSTQRETVTDFWDNFFNLFNF